MSEQKAVFLKLNIDEVKELYSIEWMSYRAIAEMYDVSSKKIEEIVKRNGFERIIPDELSRENLTKMIIVDGMKPEEVVEKFDWLPKYIVRREIEEYGLGRKKRVKTGTRVNVSQKRLDQIQNLLDDGKPVKEIAGILDTTTAYLYGVMRDNGIETPVKRKRVDIPDELALQMIDEYKQDPLLTVRDLANIHGKLESHIYDSFKRHKFKPQHRFQQVEKYYPPMGTHLLTLDGVKDLWHDLDGYEGIFKANDDGLVCYVETGRPRILPMKKVRISGVVDYEYDFVKRFNKERIKKDTFLRSDVLRMLEGDWMF